ncbi:response regulator [Actinoplanes regularis]|uniref:HDOD domain-containing protein n=1 Tax=Actinoplanes regularis TaxID=52697 RepID=A0A238ZS57_9ACTN|nr:response regulator [Actinoplanes regularis]SNR86266.1 HDOD domain-containing protein [Actinoplanes regularis]
MSGFATGSTSKPRVLFVDDESRILDGLRRSLRVKRNEWEMAFAVEGAEALEMLARDPYDVVVSDMRMPRMNGAELLTNISREHPHIARVVLSGHVEPDTAIQVAVAGHRFLTKPAEVTSLIAVIEQMLFRTSSAHQDAARRLAGGVRAIPTLPEHTERIAALLAPDASLTGAVQTVMHDVGLTAKLLQLSTSTFFGARPRNSSIESIVHAMGLPTVQAVAGAGHELRSTEPWDPEIEQHLRVAWRHAMATASLAGSMASPANRPYAQAAALMQDVGQLICLAEIGADQRAGLDLAAGSRDGVPFRDVGVELLHLWGLPAPVISAVAQRDRPHTPDPSGLGVAGAVRVAHLLIRQTRPGGPETDAHAAELTALLSHPQLAAQNLDWRESAASAAREAGL